VPSLREMRLRRMLTQKDLAKRAEVSYQTVQAWEGGQSRPRPAAMRRLAEALEVTPDDLFDAIESGLSEEPKKAAA